MRASAQEQTKESSVPGGAVRPPWVSTTPGHRKGDSSERLCALAFLPRLLDRLTQHGDEVLVLTRNRQGGHSHTSVVRLRRAGRAYTLTT